MDPSLRWDDLEECYFGCLIKFRSRGLAPVQLYLLWLSLSRSLSPPLFFKKFNLSPQPTITKNIKSIDSKTPNLLRSW